MSEDSKQKKVDSGKNLLNNYLKKKKNVHDRRSEGAQGEYGYEEKPNASESIPGVDENKMDPGSLQKSTAKFMSLNATIQKLQDTVSEQTEFIEALKIENKSLRHGRGDQPSVSESEPGDKMIDELKKMVDGRDTYIKQVSDSLQKRSDELSTALKREKELTNKIQELQQEVKKTMEENESKLTESVMLSVGHKADMLKEECSESSKSLRLSLEISNKKIEELKHETHEKDKKMYELKYKTANEVKQLMKQVEELNQNILKKDTELNQAKQQVERLLSSMDQQIGERIFSMRKELDKEYKEKVKSVENIYDSMMLTEIRKSDTELKSTDELKKEIESCRYSYEQEIICYKEQLHTLLEKSKQTEEQLEKYKQEAEKYKQQIENYKNDLSEEINKMRNECYLELDEFKSKVQISKSNEMEEYQEEIDNLSKKLQIYALQEGSKEVEIESLRHELRKKEDIISDHLNDLESYKASFQKQQDQLSQMDSELNYYKHTNSQIQTKVNEFQKRELNLLHDLKMSNSKIEYYEQQIPALNKQLEANENKYEQMNQMFQDRLKYLTDTLEKDKQLHEEDVNKLTDVINELKAQISRPTGGIVEENNSTMHFNDNLLTQNTNKDFLLNIWRGLAKIKAQINTLFDPNSFGLTPHIDQDQLPNEYSRNISIQELTVEVEKTLGNVLDMTQYLEQNGSGLSQSVCQVLETSTPNINTSNRILKDTDTTFTSESDNIQRSDNDDNSWASKYSKLEEENASLCRNLKVMINNLYEMGTSLIVVSQESSLFNKRCQDLDGKLSELENSKLTEYLLKQENDELKQKLRNCNESEKKMYEKFSLLQDNNLKLEGVINNSIKVIMDGLEKSDSNVDLKCLLTDLKEKSDEAIQLKLKVASLQEIEQEQRSRITEIQSEHELLIAKFKFLTSELSAKTKELEEIWQEKYRLSTENKFLYRKLVFHDKLAYQLQYTDKNSENSNTFSSETVNDDIQQRHEEEVLMQYNTPNDRDIITDQIKYLQSHWKCQQRDEGDNELSFHMPMITEEDEVDKFLQNDHHSEKDQVSS